VKFHQLGTSGTIIHKQLVDHKTVTLTGRGINPYFQDFNDQMYLLIVAGQNTVLLEIT
jgi:hypothetical protein